MPDRLDDMDLAALTREAERLGYVRDGDGAEVVAWRKRAGGPPIVRTRRGWGAWWAWDAGTGDEADALRWLLRQPEAQARAACYARGVADGRAQVIAEVRGDGASPALAALADALERGDDEVREPAEPEEK